LWLWLRGGAPYHRAAATDDRGGVRWVGKFDRWLVATDTFVETCSGTYRSEVGKAPTPRLRRVARLALSLCRRFARVAARSNARAKRDLEAAGAQMKRLDRRLDAIRPGRRRLPAHAGSSGSSRIDPRYSRVASKVSGVAHVRVRCWSSSDWKPLVREYRVYTSRPLERGLLGFAAPPRDIDLSPEACRYLDKLVYGQARPRTRLAVDRLAVGANTLAHESMHLRWPREPEAFIECYGMQATRDTAELLGVEETYSPKLPAAYYRDIYPHQAPSYRSPECRRGGRLDWDPDDYFWP